jgi:polar amino acid transport system substrate-binding protein
MPAMTRSAGFKCILCVAIGVVGALSGRASSAEPLRFATLDRAVPAGDEIVKQVLATMGRDVIFEPFPYRRAWLMIVRGERDGLTDLFRTSERERFCTYADEPYYQSKLVLWVRTADAGKLKFSSFGDLIGHGVAVGGSLITSEDRESTRELSKFLREHHNEVQTRGIPYSLRMLAAGRVDYAIASLVSGRFQSTKMGLSERIEPILSPIVATEGSYVCFAKTRVSPSFVDEFSRAQREFKKTEAYQVILRKYFGPSGEE